MYFSNICFWIPLIYNIVQLEHIFQIHTCYIIVYKLHMIFTESLYIWLQNQVQNVYGQCHCRVEHCTWHGSREDWDKNTDDWNKMWHQLFCYTMLVIKFALKYAIWSNLYSHISLLLQIIASLNSTINLPGAGRGRGEGRGNLTETKNNLILK